MATVQRGGKRLAPSSRRRKRRRRRGRLSMPLALVLALCLMTGGVALSRRSTPPAEMPEWVTPALLPENPYSRPGDALERVNGIVIHYVGNPGTSAQNNRDYFASLAQTGQTYASSHFIVGLDGEILQCVPLGEIAYCSNDRNADTLSIECCHPDESGQFSPESYQALVKLAGYLVRTYQLKEDDIIRHYDVSGKLCPLYYVEHQESWEQLKGDIWAAAREDTAQKQG